MGEWCYKTVSIDCLSYSSDEKNGCTRLLFAAGNLDWVGNEFTFNAGAGLVISQPQGFRDRNSTVVEQLRAAFERDWNSRYTRSLQANKIPVCNKHQLSRLDSVKASHLDPRAAGAPLSAGQLDAKPAAMRNSHTDDGETAPKMWRRNGKVHQSAANGMVSHGERGRGKASHPDDRPTPLKDNFDKDNLIDLAGQSAESSGSREISNGSL